MIDGDKEEKYKEPLLICLESLILIGTETTDIRIKLIAANTLKKVNEIIPQGNKDF